MIRCLHTADLHLDARFPSLGEKEGQRRNDFLRTLQRMVTLAIAEQVQLFLVAGDLFDSPHPDAATIGRVQGEIDRLLAHGIVPVLLPGTHDTVAVRESVYLNTNFNGAVILNESRVETPTRIEVAGNVMWLYGIAYRSGATDGLLQSMARRGEAGIHIGLLHGSRRGSPEWQHRPKDFPFDTAELATLGLDYIALGHYHEYDEIRSDGRLVACYPGSPEGKRFGENGPRYCLVVEIDHGQAAVTRHAVQTRRLEEIELDLSGCDSLETAASQLGGLADTDLLLRLRLTGTVEVPLPLEVLLNRCRDGFFFLDLIDRSRFFDSQYAQRIAHEETVRGLFVRRARRMLEEAPPERQRVVEDAFREVLARFRLFSGGDA